MSKRDIPEKVKFLLMKFSYLLNWREVAELPIIGSNPESTNKFSNI